MSASHVASSNKFSLSNQYLQRQLKLTHHICSFTPSPPTSLSSIQIINHHESHCHFYSNGSERWVERGICYWYWFATNCYLCSLKFRGVFASSSEDANQISIAVQPYTYNLNLGTVAWGVSLLVAHKCRSICPQIISEPVQYLLFFIEFLLPGVSYAQACAPTSVS